MVEQKGWRRVLTDLCLLLCHMGFLFKWRMTAFILLPVSNFKAETEDFILKVGAQRVYGVFESNS